MDPVRISELLSTISEAMEELKAMLPAADLGEEGEPTVEIEMKSPKPKPEPKMSGALLLRSMKDMK